MARYVMKLPDVGEGVVEAEILQWSVQVGDTVTEDQPLLDVMTDKANVEITSPVGGKVLEVHGKAGEMLAVGAELIVFETDPTAATAQKAPADTAANKTPAPPTKPEPAPPTPQPPAPPKAAPQAPPVVDALNAAPLAAPTVRRRAREAFIDLQEVPGTGKGGRITQDDLDAYLRQRKTGAGSDRLESSRVVKVTGLRRLIAEKMQRSVQHIPHYAYVEEVDVTELEKLRQQLNQQRREGQEKLTYLPFMMRALVKALPDFPHCNAHFDDQAGEYTEFGHIHIGIATQTPDGLKVPVVKHAQALDLWQSAAELKRVSNAARDNSASRDILSGSTITLTSLGALGGIATTPIINPPEVAIIGINKTRETWVMQGGQVVPRRVMNLSSSFDHRIVDGYDAARLIQSLKQLLEQPISLFV